VTPILEVERLSCGYDDGRPVLREVTFTLGPGERVGIVGANGAGKSTLLWAILGLRRAKGTVRILGQPARSVRNRLGVVFQNPEDMLFMPTLLQDVTLPLLNRGIDAAAAERKALDTLALMDLEAYANAPAGRLSLGLRKRAAIAAALAPEPELLVLDEPTAELDGRSVRRLSEYLCQLSIPYLITSHNLDFLRGVSSRLIVLIAGKLQGDAPTAAVLADTALLERAALI
jgi:cobalt/nickel transport system ATP-binding protein